MSAVSSIPADNAAAAEARQRAAEARFTAQLIDHITELTSGPVPVPGRASGVSDAYALGAMSMAIARLIDLARAQRLTISEVAKHGLPTPTKPQRRPSKPGQVVDRFASDMDDVMAAAGHRWEDRASVLDEVREGVHRELLRQADQLDDLYREQHPKTGRPELTAAERNGL